MKEENTSEIHFSSPYNLHFHAGKHPFCILIPEIEEWFHTQTRRSTAVSLMPPYVGLRSPKIHLLFQVTDFIHPFPKRQWWSPEPAFWQQRLCWLGKMRGRKEKRVSYFLSFTFKVLEGNHHSSSRVGKTEFIGFPSQLAQLSCFFPPILYIEHHWRTPAWT